MKDYLGKEVLIGDKVICIVKGYCTLTKGFVVRVTPQTVLVEYNSPNIRNRMLQKRCTSDQIIKIEENT